MAKISYGRAHPNIQAQHVIPLFLNLAGSSGRHLPQTNPRLERVPIVRAFIEAIPMQTEVIQPTSVSEHIVPEPSFHLSELEARLELAAMPLSPATAYCCECAGRPTCVPSDL